MIDSLLEERALLPILTMNAGTEVTLENWQERRKEMLDLLSRYSYGYTPTVSVSVRSQKTQDDDILYDGLTCCEHRDLILTDEATGKEFRFPFVISLPARTEKKVPGILFISGHGLIGDFRDAPVKETNEAGFALIQLFFADLINDNHYGDFSGGLSEFFGLNDPRKPDEWGKIGMWAYGTSRVMDYLLTREDLDTDHLILSGHSRLGKTILWAAAQDDRYYGIIDNASGYGGAATSKHGTGERVTDFLRAGSWDWFCENFKDYAGEKEDEKPYDQAFVLALLAPKYLCIGTADLDPDADPVSIYLTAHHASSAWHLLGKEGLVTPDRLPATGDVFHSGTIGFHMRHGKHALTLEDWGHFLDFYREKLLKEDPHYFD